MRLHGEGLTMNTNDIHKIIELLDKEQYKEVRKALIRFLPKQKKSKYAITFDTEKLEDIAFNFREKLVKNQTKAEIKFKAVLKAANIDYEFQSILFYPRKNGGKSFYIVDFYLPFYNTVIEIDGGYHKDTNQKNKDKDRVNSLKANGISKVLRYTNEEVENNTASILDTLSSPVTFNTVKRKYNKSLDGNNLQEINGRKYKKRNEKNIEQNITEI